MLAGMAVLFLLICILVAAVLGRRTLNQFTDTQPMPLPRVEIPQAQIDEVQQRVQAFVHAVRTGEPAQPLELNANEINALIATDENLEAFKGKLYVILEGTQFKGQVSVPLADLGLRRFKGRYLNGLATFSLAITNGQLQLGIQSLTVRSKPLPRVYLEKIGGLNLAQDLVSNPRAAAALRKVQDIYVRDGKLVIVPKPE